MFPWGLQVLSSDKLVKRAKVILDLLRERERERNREIPSPSEKETPRLT
jgi:hypothetical protein